MLTEQEIIDRYLAGQITEDQARAAFLSVHPEWAQQGGWQVQAMMNTLNQQLQQNPYGMQDPGLQPVGTWGPGGAVMPPGTQPYSPTSAGVPSQSVLERRGQIFAEESPAEAFTRYLLALQGTQPWAQPAREAAQTRGVLLENLIPLMGQGPRGEQSYYDIFREQFPTGGPAGSALDERLRQLAQASQMDPSLLTDAQRGMLFPFLGTEGAETGKFQELMGRNALIGARQLRASPGLRGGISGLIQRLYSEQKARTPEMPFLNYAQQQGWF